MLAQDSSWTVQKKQSLFIPCSSFSGAKPSRFDCFSRQPHSNQGLIFFFSGKTRLNHLKKSYYFKGSFKSHRAPGVSSSLLPLHVTSAPKPSKSPSASATGTAVRWVKNTRDPTQPGWFLFVKGQVCSQKLRTHSKMSILLKLIMFC